MQSRRQFIKTVGIMGITTMGGCSLTGKKTTSKKPPNIIIIFTDDQGYG